MNSFQHSVKQKMNAEIRPGNRERQHDLDQDLPAARAIDQRAFSSSNGMVLK